MLAIVELAETVPSTSLLPKERSNDVGALPSLEAFPSASLKMTTAFEMVTSELKMRVEYTLLIM